MKGSFFRNFLLIGAAALLCVSAGAQEVTTGSISGTVYDNTGGVLPGAMVALASAEGSKSTTTDGNGGFRFLYLTPGTYQLKASMHGFTSVEQKNIGVRLGARVRIEVTLTPGAAQTIEVSAAAPTVNLDTATTGASLSSELLESIPIGRTFSSALALSPGVVEGGIGAANPSIGGASGLENTYVIDGVNINNSGYGGNGSYSIVFGSLGTGTTMDYIQEIQVKTGGYEPEFGEALGGYVNLITKSGGNAIKGSVYTYLESGALDADRDHRDDHIDTQVVDFNDSDSYDVGLEMGGPLAEDKAFFYGAFNPRFTQQDLQSGLLVRNSGINNDLERDRETWNYAGNVKFFPNPAHSLHFSAFGDPSKGDVGPQRSSAVNRADPEQAFSEIEYGGHNVTGRWNGELASNWFAEASIAYHKDRSDEVFANNLSRIIDRRTTPDTTSGGIGFFRQGGESENTQFKVKASNFFDAAGEHNLRYGFEYQDISYKGGRGYTGTEGIEIAPGFTTSTGYTAEIRTNAAGTDEFEITRTVVGPLLNTNTQKYLSFYASDSWNPAPNFSVMGGIRYEQGTMKGAQDVVFLTKTEAVAEAPSARGEDWKLDSNWSPRIHVTWDPTNDNKSKVFFAWGRFFGKVPLDIVDRFVSGDGLAGATWPLASVDFSDPTNPRPIGAPISETVSLPTASGGNPIDPDAKLTYQDEVLFGAEYEVLPFFNLGGSFMYRDLGRTMEDVNLIPYREILTTFHTTEFFATNPGDVPGFPSPARKYQAFTLKADKRMHDNWQMLGSYTWAKLEGNYEGFFRRDNGQSDPFITSLFDFPYLEDPDLFINQINDGELPNDRRHVFQLHGSYMFENNLSIGAGFRAQSGLPITRLGYLVFWGDTERVLEPRGTTGRGDWTTPLDLQVSYPLNMGGSTLQLSVDFFNLFNQQNGVDYVMRSEKGGVVNGITACPTCTDFIVDAIGRPVGNPDPTAADPDFNKIAIRQAPREIRFTARWRFGG